MDKDIFIKFLKDEYEVNKGNAEMNRPTANNNCGMSWYEYGYWCGVKEYLADLITLLQDDQMVNLIMKACGKDKVPEGKNVEFAHDFLEQNKLTKADFIYKYYTEWNDHMEDLDVKYDLYENDYDTYKMLCMIIDTAFGLLEEYSQKENN